MAGATLDIKSNVGKATSRVLGKNEEDVESALSIRRVLILFKSIMPSFCIYYLVMTLRRLKTN